MTRQRSQRHGRTLVAWALLVGLLSPGAALAQSGVAATSGQGTFENYCVTCHGRLGKGDGPLASSMKTPPADLTLIARRAGGVFPAEQVARIIDGRNPVKGHGGGDMPVWGDAFAKTIDTVSSGDRIQRLVAYLESIQLKP